MPTILNTMDDPESLLYLHISEGHGQYTASITCGQYDYSLVATSFHVSEFQEQYAARMTCGQHDYSLVANSFQVSEFQDSARITCGQYDYSLVATSSTCLQTKKNTQPEWNCLMGCWFSWLGLLLKICISKNVYGSGWTIKPGFSNATMHYTANKSFLSLINDNYILNDLMVSTSDLS